MVFIVIILVLFIVDDKIKQYIEENKEMNKQEEIFHGHIIIERYHNKGAMLNFLEKKSYLVKYISATILGILLVILACFLPKKGDNVLKLGLSLVLGGAFSNVYDRIKKGYVVDYFSFKWLKNIIFNLSDICIFVGSFIIALLSIIKGK